MFPQQHQLNATANVRYIYLHPPAERRLPHPEQYLICQFRPDRCSELQRSKQYASTDHGKRRETSNHLTDRRLNLCTALSGDTTQCDGQCAWLIYYAPVSGTILNAGPNQPVGKLCAYGCVNYNSVSSTAHITVNKALSARQSQHSRIRFIESGFHNQLYGLCE